MYELEGKYKIGSKALREKMRDLETSGWKCKIIKVKGYEMLFKRRKQNAYQKRHRGK